MLTKQLISSLLSPMIFSIMLLIFVGKIGFSVIEEFNNSSDQIESTSDSEESDDSTQSEEFIRDSFNHSPVYKDRSMLTSEIEERIYQEVILGVQDTIIGISSPPPES